MFSCDEQLENSVQSFLMEASHMYFQKNFERLSEWGIHPGQIPIIWLVNAVEGMNQREIAARLGIKPPSVNVSISRLERIGFVCRRPDKEDQRVSRVFLTDSGRKLNDRIQRILMENEEILTENFTESELILLKRMFRQLLENMENLRDTRNE